MMKRNWKKCRRLDRKNVMIIILVGLKKSRQPIAGS
jgi:hypothetical protein